MPKKGILLSPFAKINSSFVLIKSFYESFQKWRQHVVPDDLMGDVYDGDVWTKKFQGVDQSNFVQTPFNLMFFMNVDWFQPFTHVKCIHCTVMYQVRVNWGGGLRMTIPRLPDSSSVDSITLSCWCCNPPVMIIKVCCCCCMHKQIVRGHWSMQIEIPYRNYIILYATGQDFLHVETESIANMSFHDLEPKEYNILSALSSALACILTWMGTNWNKMCCWQY